MSYIASKESPKKPQNPCTSKSPVEVSPALIWNFSLAVRWPSCGQPSPWPFWKPRGTEPCRCWCVIASAIGSGTVHILHRCMPISTVLVANRSGKMKVSAMLLKGGLAWQNAATVSIEWWQDWPEAARRLPGLSFWWWIWSGGSWFLFCALSNGSVRSCNSSPNIDCWHHAKLLMKPPLHCASAEGPKLPNYIIPIWNQDNHYA